MRAVAELCRLCGHPGGRVVSAADTFRAVRCRCGFITLHSGIDEARLEDHYQEYLPTNLDEIERWRREQSPVISRAARQIVALKPNGRLLDIGCGFGFFPAEMIRRGFEAFGLEVSAVGCQHAAETLGVQVYRGLLEEQSFSPHSFDVVTAFYVIEHVTDPRVFLQQVRRLLKPDGLVFLRWPHSTPLAMILDRFGIHHDLYHRPWHLSDFTPATMERLLREEGFTDVRTRTLGGTNSGGFFGSLLSRGAAALSDGLEIVSGARWHLPGVSKTTWGSLR